MVDDELWLVHGWPSFVKDETTHSLKEGPRLDGRKIAIIAIDMC